MELVIRSNITYDTYIEITAPRKFEILVLVDRVVSSKVDLYGNEESIHMRKNEHEHAWTRNKNQHKTVDCQKVILTLIYS